jgi:hypothetical protein
MKSHTGGVISMGTGGILCQSTKQKLTTKSSTKAELVGASNYIPKTIWSKFFLEAQGYNIKSNVFEQDNGSAIRLESNGRASAGRQSRHIDIRYFFMKDCLKADNIVVRHCPTEHMLADFFTKPLQGALFRKFRDILLGYHHISTLDRLVTSVPEERVGISLGNSNLGDGSGTVGPTSKSTVETKKKDKDTRSSNISTSTYTAQKLFMSGRTGTDSTNMTVEKVENSSTCNNVATDTWSVVVRKRTRSPTTSLSRNGSSTKLTIL